MAKPAALIVGGGGYFGARLAEALTDTHAVTVTYRSMGALRQAWIDRSGVTALAFDSADASGLATDTDTDFDLVVNLAMPGAREAQADADLALERGLAGARACAALLETGRARRLVHASTFHVYGGDGAPDYAETTPPAPKHPYGAAHLAVEHFLADHPNAADVQIIRPTNMVGAPAHMDLGAQAGLIFLDLCRQAAQTGRMELRNDGLSYRDILPFGDAIAAVRVLAAAAAPEHQVYNLAAGEAVTLKTIAEGIAEGIQDDVEIAYGAGTDAFRTPFNVEIARLRALGWAPTHDFRAEAPATVAGFA